MVQGTITRVVSAACALAAAFALVVGLAPATAQAAPKAAKPDAVAITGTGIQKITVTSAQQSELFQLLLSEVSWMSSATPQTNPPKAKNLGPKYVIVVSAGGKAQQAYELYPMAVGGPRAHRAAKQPAGKTTDGWFYGRLTMSESLRYAGIPLEKRSDIGGIGGGFSEQSTAEEVNPVDTVNEAFGQFRQLFLLNGAVLVVILFGLAGIAFLIRRRV
ncbi:hypothetical protein [Actinoplanes sp. NBRC 103695]|uniref:hypothetical protein n=1 Tax=Actinoplanes sp. NBRC 103695 TaxID=3032202 RepID=UPI0024A0550F|nr:hypothetical protein [Actinoplanes sp. NBRC 103695]GLY97690.1 hypothetical protein Acsp02_49440 [Actinoplanes sp. NBRC 103695]